MQDWARGVFAVDRELGSGYAQQWNFAVQRELGRNLVAEVAYAGSKITHVGIPDTNINQLPLLNWQWVQLCLPGCRIRSLVRYRDRRV